ncbi:MAG: hypothetical protein PUD32_00480 [Bacteroidales bacterium]|nr:hypothetical protein [Bacteroidales bacterium]
MRPQGQQPWPWAAGMHTPRTAAIAMGSRHAYRKDSGKSHGQPACIPQP